MRRALSETEAALPWNDPAVDGLDDATRARVGRYWEGRSIAELQVADAFEQVRAQLADAAADRAVLELLRQSIANEHEHAQVCRRLAQHYTGREPTDPPATVVRLPELAGARDGARATLQMAGLCCINESIATVWLQGCATRAASPLVRAANQLHVADEVLHARVGWAHLASAAITAPVRAEVGRWLPALLRSTVGDWLSPRVAEQAAGVPDHGLPTEADHRQVVLNAVRDVVLPGFEHCRIDTRTARRWFDSFAAAATT